MHAAGCKWPDAATFGCRVAQKVIETLVDGHTALVLALKVKMAAIIRVPNFVSKESLRIQGQSESNGKTITETVAGTYVVVTKS
jgi:hypothetical protein